MDPNATLKEIREIVAKHEHPSSPDIAHEWLDELAEKIQALDEWLSKGGFLPTDWRTRSRL